MTPTSASINQALRAIGISHPPEIGSTANGLPDGWWLWLQSGVFAGYTSVLFLAGITNISPDLYEAAEIDGANTFQRILHIILPLLKSVTVFVILTTMIGCFQIFEEPFMIFKVMGKLIGGPRNAVLTGMWFFYDTSFGSTMRFGYGSAIAFGMLITIAVITFVVNALIKTRRDVK